jgi:hypothetical protein
MQALGMDATEYEISKMVEDIDADGNGDYCSSLGRGLSRPCADLDSPSQPQLSGMSLCQ